MFDNSAVIPDFLKKKFPWARWLITTHSCDLVAHTQNANLVVREDGSWEIMDINDYASVSEVQIVFKRLFGTPAEQESQINNVLRRLLNNKMNHAWSEKDEECLMQIENRRCNIMF